MIPQADSKVKQLQDRMQLSDAQLARIERAFQKFDPDNTRHVDKTRLALVMEELGHRPRTDQELDGLFRWTDSDASGLVGFDEFVSLMVVRNNT